MTTQTTLDSVLPEQISVPTIESYSGRSKKLSSLRPGDRIKTYSGNIYTVLQNSATLQRAELAGEGWTDSFSYVAIRYEMKPTVLPPSLFWRAKKWLRRMMKK